MEGRIKGNGIYQGRKLQGIPGKEKEMGRTQETQGKGRMEERKKDSGKETSWKKETQWQQETKKKRETRKGKTDQETKGQRQLEYQRRKAQWQ